MLKHIEAPFTPEQVEALNRWQRNGNYHPFTCGNCRDADTEAEVAHFKKTGKWKRGKEQRELVATEKGWICPTCDYTQSWAYAIMAGEGNV